MPDRATLPKSKRGFDAAVEAPLFYGFTKSGLPWSGQLANNLGFPRLVPLSDHAGHDEQIDNDPDEQCQAGQEHDDEENDSRGVPFLIDAAEGGSGKIAECGCQEKDQLYSAAYIPLQIESVDSQVSAQQHEIRERERFLGVPHFRLQHEKLFQRQVALVHVIRSCSEPADLGGRSFARRDDTPARGCDPLPRYVPGRHPRSTRWW